MGEMVLSNLDESLQQKLRARAAEHGRSMPEEAVEILRQTLAVTERHSNDEFIRLAAECRAMTAGRIHTPSEILVREGRDER